MGTQLYRVVLVERDQNMLNTLLDYIKRDSRFCVVEMFTEEGKAKYFLKDNQVDLLLLSFDRSGNFGTGLLKEILENEIDIDVIAMTGVSEGESLKEALHLGVIDYLIQPFSQKRFKQSLEGYISRMKISEGLKTADQETVDHLLHYVQATAQRAGAKSEREQRIMECFEMSPKHEFTVKEVAQKLGFSSVTVRRDLKRLADAGRIISNIDYNTGGHPRIVYRLP